MSNYYQQQQQQPYYDYEPHHSHNNYQHDAYAMKDMTRPSHDADYYPQYESKPQPSTADGYYSNSPQQLLTKHQRLSDVAAEFNENEKFSRAHNKNRSCCDKICCGCCTCCPRWCRWFSCILLLIIIGLGIAIGVLAATFKVPSVEFKGMQGDPAFGLAGTTVNLNISLGFVVDNPNVESVTFKSLAATANYHGDTTPLGGGTLNDLHIGSYSVTNISFPFAISMNVLDPGTQAVVSKIMSDCGIGGGTAQDINLDYKVVATVSIIGIPISVPYSSSVGFKCPIDEESQASLNQIATLLSGLAGGAAASDLIGGLTGGGLPTDAIPSDIANAIPSDVTNAIPSDIAGLVGGQ